MKSHIGTEKEKFITGYIAQHVQEYYPDMVIYDQEEDLYMVDKMVLLPVLHRGWQLHEDRIITLEKEIIKLKEHIAFLEDQLN